MPSSNRSIGHREQRSRCDRLGDTSFSDQERPFEGFSPDLGPREADAQPPFALFGFVAETETQDRLLHDLIDQSIAIHRGEMSTRELVEAYLERIKRFDPGVFNSTCNSMPQNWY